MRFELKLRAIVFESAPARGQRFCAELVAADSSAAGQNPTRQAAYFNTVAFSISRLDCAGLREKLCAEIKNAVEAAIRAPGTAVRVKELFLDHSQLTLGFRVVAINEEVNVTKAGVRRLRPSSTAV